MATPDSTATHAAGSTGATLARYGPGYAALVGLVALSILLQAVFAGEFIQPGSSGGWLGAHEANATVATALALISAIYAAVLLRRVARSLVVGSIVLFVVLAVMAELGYAIHDSPDNDLTPVHVPLALLAFGLTIWLSARARSLRRAAAAG
jgi:hypothetical protein